MRKFSALVLSLIIIIPSSFILVDSAKSPGSEIILKVAVLGDMRTKNILNANDIWTNYVLWCIYDTVGHLDPSTYAPIPYILRGTDANGNGKLDNDEIGVFSNVPGHPKNVTAFYDFHNVYFHDGEPVDIKDVLFSYHILAPQPSKYMDPFPVILGNYDFLMGEDYSDTHQLFLREVDDGDDDPLTSALRFELQRTYANFFINALIKLPILPQHLWEDTGKVRKSDGTYKTNIHADFGYAIDSDGIGIPPNHPTLKPFDLLAAMKWEPKNDEVIGTGMFKFKESITGSHSKLVRNDNYVEMVIGDISIHKSFIDGIEFIKYSTQQQATMALKKGEVDLTLRYIRPDYIIDLLADTNIAVRPNPSTNPSPQIYYITLNMRLPILGYQNYPNNLTDVGKPLRKAIECLIDKKTIVNYYLQGYGVIADSFVHPYVHFWYNSTLPTCGFSIEMAESILDSNGLTDNDGDGWRDLDLTNPGDQDNPISIVAPTVEYSPVEASICLLLDDNMRKAGINATCNQKTFAQIISMLYSKTKDFQMVLGRGSIALDDPTDYLYNFFYSTNAEDGQNFAGYRNSLFDQVISTARSELNLEERKYLVKWAQGILAEDLPAIPLFYRDNIEAYRRDRFEGWIEHSGSIFNYWSLMNIHPPGFIPGVGYLEVLKIFISSASAVASNSTETVTVTVKITRTKYGEMENFQGAHVALETTNGYISPSNGTTNLNGQFITTFHAPYAPPYFEHGMKVFITAKVSMKWYESHSVTTLISIFPSGIKFLSATIYLPFGDLVYESRSTVLSLFVKDEMKNPAENATVNIYGEPKNASIEPNNGSTTAGTIGDIEFIAPWVVRDTLYKITINASKNDYVNANASVGIYVLAMLPDGPPPPNHIIELLLLVIVFVAVTAVLIELQRPKQKPKR